MKKVPKQDEQVNLLRIRDYKLKSSSTVIIYTTKINSKAFAIPILTASGLDSSQNRDSKCLRINFCCVYYNR